MKNGTVLTVGASSNQIKDIQKFLLDIVPNRLSHRDAQRMIANKGKLQKKLRNVVNEYLEASPYEQQLLSWQDFYREYFGMELDFSEIEIPETKDGFDRLIIIAKGITINQVYDACAKQFSCWRYVDNLDKDVTTNDRTSHEAYTVWVRNNIEADEQYKDTSAKELTKRSIKGITLLERLVLELKYFAETGNHLDIINVTLCSGSRDSDGGVPDVDWYASRLRVDWCYTDYSRGCLRCREVV